MISLTFNRFDQLLFVHVASAVDIQVSRPLIELIDSHLLEFMEKP
jgi:hypothetical protein